MDAYEMLAARFVSTVAKEDVCIILSRLCPENLFSRSHYRFIRRSYFAKGPNYIWPVDGYDKLKPYKTLTSTLIMSSRWSNTSVVLSAVASFSWGDYVKSVTLLVKKSPSIWSRHSSSADWTTATLYSQASRVDHQTVAACTECRCSSRHWHQAKWPHNSSSDALTLAAEKSRNLYKLCFLMHLIHINQRPAYMAEMVELTATSSSRSGFRYRKWLADRRPDRHKDFAVSSTISAM